MSNIRFKFFVLLTLAFLGSFFWSYQQTPITPPSELISQGDVQAPITYADPDGPGPLVAGSPRLEGSLAIDLEDNCSPEDLTAFRESHSLDVKYVSVHSVDSGLTVATLPEAEMAATIEALGQDPRVEAVSPNYIYSICDEDDDDEEEEATQSFPNDPEFKYQWHMGQIRATDAWRWTSGEGITVAVIDTGVAYADTEDEEFHQVEDLKDTRFVEGYDFINKREEAYDDHCHGTHVAGTVAQSTNNGKGVTGVAFGSTVMPIKVLSGRGSGSNAGVAAGIRFAADNGAKVMNLSLGGPTNSKVMEEAVQYAVSKGTVVVCAAGNSNRPRSGFPAGCEGAISVSALDYGEQLTFYSNYGTDIDIAAPGGDTRSDKNGDGKPDGVYQNTIRVGRPTESGYFNFQGTSMASPHAAGVFALGASFGITKRETLEKLVLETAREAPPSEKVGYGAGILDAGSLAQKAGLEFGQLKILFSLLCGLLAYSFYLRRGKVLSVIATIPTLLLGSVGVLWWVPALALNDAPLSPYAVSGLPSWDMFLFGVDQHGSLPFHSALIPMMLCFLTLMAKFLRPLAVGLCAGVGGHLVFVLLHDTVEMAWLPEGIQQLWLLANVLFCVVLATACAARK